MKSTPIKYVSIGTIRNLILRMKNNFSCASILLHNQSWNFVTTNKQVSRNSDVT